MLELTPAYFTKVIDLLYTKAVELELFHDRFFELQALIAELSEDEQSAFANHPDAPAMEEKLAATLAILKKLKV